MEEKSGFILYFDLLGCKQIVKRQSFEEKRSLAKLLDSVLPALSKRMFYCWSDGGLDYEDALQGLKKAARRISQQGYDPKLVSKLQWAIDRANLYFRRDQKKRIVLKESHRLSLDIEEISTHE